MWFVIYEYEIYNDTKPSHQWTCVGVHQHKDKAIAQALEENFNQFCRNQTGRWPPEFKSKKSLSPKDKEKIVEFVLNNINNKTGSENDWNGTGYWIVSDETLKLPEDKQSGELIDDLFEYFEDSESGEEEENNSSDEEEIKVEAPVTVKPLPSSKPINNPKPINNNPKPINDPKPINNPKPTTEKVQLPPKKEEKSRPRRSSVDSIRSDESGLANEFSESDSD